MNQLDFQKLLNRNRSRLSEIALDVLGCFQDGKPKDSVSAAIHLESIHTFDRPNASNGLAVVGLQHLVAAGVVTVDRAGFHRLTDPAAQIEPKRAPAVADDKRIAFTPRSVTGQNRKSPGNLPSPMESKKWQESD